MHTLKNITISHGTHRPVDLIPAFLNVLCYVDDMGPVTYSVYTSAAKTLRLLSILDQNNQYPSQRLYERASYDIEELIEVVNIHAPEGFYFGAHPGDGSDFGFWQVEDDF